MRSHLIKQEKPVIEDIADSFLPGTLNKPASKAAIMFSTALIAASVGMKILNQNDTAAYALGSCALVGLIGGLAQSKGLVTLSILSDLGLSFAATVGYGLGLHSFITIRGR